MKEEESAFFHRIPAGAGLVSKALRAARSFSEAAGLGEERAKLAIIVEELVFNILDHGQPGEGDHVELAFERVPEGVRLILTDSCAPFDPREAEPEGDEPPERGGGAGLALVKAWSRIVDYASEGGRNRLELVVVLDR
jgi:anti-sigma regulatory factor (Ser/Thr protein kinase)